MLTEHNSPKHNLRKEMAMSRACCDLCRELFCILSTKFPDLDSLAVRKLSSTIYPTALPPFFSIDIIKLMVNYCEFRLAGELEGMVFSAPLSDSESDPDDAPL